MRHLLVAAVLGCALGVPSPAHAQFGLGKKIRNAAAQAAGVETGSVRTGKVSFDDQLLEITEPRLDRFLKGLEAEEQMVARIDAQDDERIERENRKIREAYEASVADYQRRDEAWEKCADPIQSRGQRDMQAYGASVTDSAAMQRVAERIKAAQQRGDMAEIQRLADSVGKASMTVANRGQSMAASANDELLRTCGERPTEPGKPTYQPLLSHSDVRRAGLEASGFDDGQYSMLRERIVPFVMTKGKDSGRLVYTEEEVAALQGRLEALSKYAEILKSY
ncbi:MAG TPA: hypothetical protein VFU00_08690 [Gemmatimonadales bacterium]|nr:hypothetical protein [Gemmatimonadales bacterium]